MWYLAWGKAWSLEQAWADSSGPRTWASRRRWWEGERTESSLHSSQEAESQAEPWPGALRHVHPEQSQWTAGVWLVWARGNDSLSHLH